jgi:hypothetical protein
MKYLTVTPFKEFGKFPKMSGDRGSYIAIAPSQLGQATASPNTRGR